MREISITDYDLSSICRLCLTSGVSVIDIFSFSTTLRNQIADAIMKCAPVQITRRDEMPTLICQLCSTQLEQSHQFQLQIVQSEKTLRRYLQKLHEFNKRKKPECSNRKGPVDPIIDKTNLDLTVKSETLELHGVADMDVTWNEKEPSNFSSVNTINEEMSLKSKIMEEPTKNSFILTENTNDQIIDKTNADTTVKSESLEGISDMDVSWKERGTENEINEEMSLKSEIIDEPMNDTNDPLIDKSKADTTVKSKSLEGTWKERELINCNSENKLNKEMSVKSEIIEEPMNDTNDQIIDNTNADTTVKSESLEDIVDMDGIWKEKELVNCNSENKTNEEMSLKSEIIEEPINDTNNTLIDKTKTDTTVKRESLEGTWKEREPINCNSENKINEDISLKSEIIEEPMNDNSLILTESINDTVKASSNGNCSEIGYVGLIDTSDTKLSENLLDKEIGPTNFNSVNKINEKVYLISKINDEPMNDNLLIQTESVKSTADTSDKTSYQQSYEQYAQVAYLNYRNKQFTSFNAPKRIHTCDNTYQCDICKKNYSTIDRLNNHKRQHTEENPYQCDVCSKEFVNLSYFKNHMRSHKGARLYYCDICNKKFSNITTHKRSHTGEKPYCCDICDKRLGSSNALRIHKRSHSGEKPFQCAVCNKSFSALSNLRCHKRQHTGEKPFQCDICDKQFTHHHTLKNHKLAHAGEKSYQCDICDKRFNYPYTLKAHKRRHS